MNVDFRPLQMMPVAQSTGLLPPPEQFSGSVATNSSEAMALDGVPQSLAPPPVNSDLQSPMLIKAKPVLTLLIEVLAQHWDQLNEELKDQDERNNHFRKITSGPLINFLNRLEEVDANALITAPQQVIAELERLKHVEESLMTPSLYLFMRMMVIHSWLKTGSIEEGAFVSRHIADMQGVVYDKWYRSLSAMLPAQELYFVEALWLLLEDFPRALNLTSGTFTPENEQHRSVLLEVIVAVRGLVNQGDNSENWQIKLRSWATQDSLPETENWKKNWGTLFSALSNHHFTRLQSDDLLNSSRLMFNEWASYRDWGLFGGQSSSQIANKYRLEPTQALYQFNAFVLTVALKGIMHGGLGSLGVRPQDFFHEIARHYDALTANLSSASLPAPAESALQRFETFLGYRWEAINSQLMTGDPVEPGTATQPDTMLNELQLVRFHASGACFERLKAELEEAKRLNLRHVRPIARFLHALFMFQYFLKSGNYNSTLLDKIKFVAHPRLVAIFRALLPPDQHEFLGLMHAMNFPLPLRVFSNRSLVYIDMFYADVQRTALFEMIGTLMRVLKEGDGTADWENKLRQWTNKPAGTISSLQNTPSRGTIQTRVAVRPEKWEEMCRAVETELIQQFEGDLSVPKAFSHIASILFEENKPAGCGSMGVELRTLLLGSALQLISGSWKNIDTNRMIECIAFASHMAPSASSRVLNATPASAPLPASYEISDRYACGPLLQLEMPIIGAGEGPRLPLPILSFTKLGSLPRCVVGVNQFPGTWKGLEGTLLTLGNPIDQNSGERITFVYAGRRENAHIPIEQAGGRVIIVCPASDESVCAGWVGENRDVLLIKSQEGVDPQQLGLIASRRLAVLRFASALKILGYLEVDDNLEDFYGSSLLVRESNWPQIYLLFSRAAMESGAVYVSARTFRPGFRAPEASQIELQPDGAIGSKIGFTRNDLLCEKVDEVDHLMPLAHNVWGEDVWKWRMLCRLGLSVRVLAPSALFFRRVQSGRGSCAATIERADYWLKETTKALYTGRSLLHKAVLEDLVGIVEVDTRRKSERLLGCDQLEADARTATRLGRLSPLALFYRKILRELYDRFTDQSSTMSSLKICHGRFSGGEVRGALFEMAERWMAESWKGTNGWLASPAAKVRLIVEAVKDLQFNIQTLDAVFDAYARANELTIHPALTELKDLIKKELGCVSPSQNSAERLPSEQALRTFLWYKKGEIYCEAADESPYCGATILTFILAASGFNLSLEAVAICFDSQGRMHRIRCGDYPRAKQILERILGQAIQNNPIDNPALFEIRDHVLSSRFLNAIRENGFSVNGEKFLVLPIEKAPLIRIQTSQQPSLQPVIREAKRKRETSDLGETKVKRKDASVRQEEDFSVTHGVTSSQSTAATSSAAPLRSNGSTALDLPPVSINVRGIGFFAELINKHLGNVFQNLRKYQIRQAALKKNLAGILYPAAPKLKRIAAQAVSLSDNERSYKIPILKKFQKESVDMAELAWKEGLGGILLAPDMGTGKTLVMMELMFRRMLRGENVLFIAPDATLIQAQLVFLGQAMDLIVPAIAREVVRLRQEKTIIAKRRSDALLYRLAQLKQKCLASDLPPDQVESLTFTMQGLISTSQNSTDDYILDRKWVRDPLVLLDPFALSQVLTVGKSLVPLSGQHEMGTLAIATSSNLLEKMRIFMPRLLIVDEASRMNNRESRAYKDLAQGLQECASVPNLLLATGTPVQNSLAEFSALIQLLETGEERRISEESELVRALLRKHAQKAFEDCEQAIGNLEEPSDDEMQTWLLAILHSFVAEEVFKQVTRSFVFRRNKREQEVIDAFEGKIPKERRTRVLIELHPNHKKMMEDLYALPQANIFETASRMSFVKIHPICHEWAQHRSEVYNPLARQLASKLSENASEDEFNAFIGQSAFLQRYLSDLDTVPELQQGPFVDVVEHLAVGYLLLGILKRRWGAGAVALMEGKLSKEEKSALIKRFRAGELKALILTRETGGVGLDLKNAKALRLIEKSWNPGEQKQAEARVSRAGVAGEVVIIDYDCQTSMDEHLEAIHKRKELLFRAVFDEVERQDGTVVADRTPLSRMNFTTRFTNFVNLLAAMKPFSSQLSRNEDTLTQVRQAFCRSVVISDGLKCYREALPEQLRTPHRTVEGVDYLQVSVESGPDSKFKVIAAAMRMARHHLDLSGEAVIPKEWYERWRDWKTYLTDGDFSQRLATKNIRLICHQEATAAARLGAPSSPATLRIQAYRHANGQYDLLLPDS